MQGLRATGIPGEGTPWMRMLERFLGEDGCDPGALRPEAAGHGGGPPRQAVAWRPAGRAAAADPGRLLHAAPAGRRGRAGAAPRSL